MYASLFLNKFRRSDPDGDSEENLSRKPVPESEGRRTRRRAQVSPEIWAWILFINFMGINDSIKRSEFRDLDSMYASAEEQRLIASDYAVPPAKHRGLCG